MLYHPPFSLFKWSTIWRTLWSEMNGQTYKHRFKWWLFCYLNVLGPQIKEDIKSCLLQGITSYTKHLTLRAYIYACATQTPCQHHKSFTQGRLHMAWAVKESYWLSRNKVQRWSSDVFFHQILGLSIFIMWNLWKQGMFKLICLGGADTVFPSVSSAFEIDHLRIVHMYKSAEIQNILFDVLRRCRVQTNWVTHWVNINALDSHALNSHYVFDLAFGICRPGRVKPFQSWQKVWFTSWWIRSCPRHNIPKLDAGWHCSPSEPHWCRWRCAGCICHRPKSSVDERHCALPDWGRWVWGCHWACLCGRPDCKHHGGPSANRDWGALHWIQVQQFAGFLALQQMGTNFTFSELSGQTTHIRILSFHHLVMTTTLLTHATPLLEDRQPMARLSTWEAQSASRLGWSFMKRSMDLVGFS